MASIEFQPPFVSRRAMTRNMTKCRCGNVATTGHSDCSRCRGIREEREAKDIQARMKDDAERRMYQRMIDLEIRVTKLERLLELR